MEAIEIVSDEDLEAHHCLEKADKVRGDPETTAFKRHARLHQAVWREARNLKEGTQPLRPKPGERFRPSGSHFALDDAGYSNFLTGAAVKAVRWRLEHPEPYQMINVDRLYGNLLSSMPLCFNLFGPLFSKADLEPTTATVRSWWPDAPGCVSAVRFEWSPGRRKPGKFLENSSAFDVAFELVMDNGTLGVIGVETKYHENCTRGKLLSEERLSRYKLVTERSGAYELGALDVLVGTPLQQIWLDHLLSLSMLQHTPQMWTWVKFVLVHPDGNPSYARASDEYRAILRDTSTFEVRTIESLLNAGVLPTDATAAFRERYLW
jgi:hypothetical protein